MRLIATLKRGLFAVAVMTLAPTAFAACLAPQPPLLAFANGTAADLKTAAVSAQTLRLALATPAADGAPEVALAFNQADGVAPGLELAATTANAPWDSRMMGWLVGIGAPPDWFTTWFASFLQTPDAGATAAVATHVRRYAAALHLGREVLVVGHAQGNVYANAARLALAQQASADDMAGFGQYAVGSTTGDVGGGDGPYLTSDRDLVAVVTGALRANAILQAADGTSAAEVTRYAAQSFDAYLSPGLDLRARLLDGLHQSLAALHAPAPACGDFDYRKQFVSLVAGNYAGSCDHSGNADPVTIGANGLFTLPSGTLDVSDPQVVFVLGRSIANAPGETADGRGVRLEAESELTKTLGSIKWDASNRFEVAEMDTVACVATSTAPPTFIASSVDIAAKAGALMADDRDSFAPNECATQDPAGLVRLPRQPISIDGTVVTVGDVRVDLASDLRDETAIIDATGDPDTTEPRFNFESTTTDGTTFVMQYGLLSGLRTFNRTGADGTIFNCVRH